MTMRKIIFLMVAIMAIGFTACSSDDDTSFSDQEQAQKDLYAQKIIGRWALVEHAYNSTTNFKVPTDEERDSLIFLTNGTVEKHLPNTTYSVSWQIEHRAVTIGTFYYNLTFNDDYSLMTLSERLGSDSFIYRYKRY